MLPTASIGWPIAWATPSGFAIASRAMSGPIDRATPPRRDGCGAPGRSDRRGRPGTCCTWYSQPRPRGATAGTPSVPAQPEVGAARLGGRPRVPARPVRRRPADRLAGAGRVGRGALRQDVALDVDRLRGGAWQGRTRGLGRGRPERRPRGRRTRLGRGRGLDGRRAGDLRRLRREEGAGRSSGRVLHGVVGPRLRGRGGRRVLPDPGVGRASRGRLRRGRHDGRARRVLDLPVGVRAGGRLLPHRAAEAGLLRRLPLDAGRVRRGLRRELRPGRDLRAEGPRGGRLAGQVDRVGRRGPRLDRGLRPDRLGRGGRLDRDRRQLVGERDRVGDRDGPVQERRRAARQGDRVRVPQPPPHRGEGRDRLRGDPSGQVDRPAEAGELRRGRRRFDRGRGAGHDRLDSLACHRSVLSSP
jgi:hypothetical protein